MAGTSGSTERLRFPWRGIPAWRLASEDLWVTVCPSRGGKLTSVFDVRAGREWLVPAPLHVLRTPTYGALWSAYEPCGWEDAFPTVGECAFPGPGRLAGVRLPDHGEVWSAEWVDESGDEVDEDDERGPLALGSPDAVMSVRGTALPYALTKRVSLSGRELRLSYTLVNEGQDPLPYQWAAWPMLGLRPDSQLVNAGGDGGWIAVLDQDRDNWLRLAWDPAEVPWLDVQTGGDALVLSPRTGAGESLAAAVERGQARTVAPGEETHWTLVATVGSSPL